jgi:hypothetical protein
MDGAAAAVWQASSVRWHSGCDAGGRGYTKTWSAKYKNDPVTVRAMNRKYGSRTIVDMYGTRQDWIRDALPTRFQGDYNLLNQLAAEEKKQEDAYEGSMFANGRLWWSASELRSSFDGKNYVRRPSRARPLDAVAVWRELYD